MADRGQLLLAAGYLLAAGWIAYELQWHPTPAETAQRSENLTVPEMKPPVTTISEIEAFDEIVRRPLFAADRKPASANSGKAKVPAPATTAERPRNLTSMRLSAILVDGEQMTALIDQANGITTKMSGGDMLEGWQLSEIQIDRVVLSSNGQTRELLLHQFDAPPPIQPRVRSSRRNAAAAARARRANRESEQKEDNDR